MSFLSTPIIRTILLRAIIINALVSLVSVAILPLYPRFVFCMGYVWVIGMQAFVVAHSIGSAAKKIWVGLDYVFSSGEVALGFWVLFWIDLPDATPWSDIPTTLIVASVRFGAGLLCASWIVRTIDLVPGRWKDGFGYLKQTFYVVPGDLTRTVYSLIFGRGLTRRHQTEPGVGMEVHPWIRNLRRVVALPIYLSLIMVAVYAIYLAPFQETGSIPAMHIRLHPEATKTIEFDLKMPVWNVIALAMPGMLSDITVTPDGHKSMTNLNEEGIFQVLPIPEGNCTRLDRPVKKMSNQNDLTLSSGNSQRAPALSWHIDNTTEGFTFHCPNRLELDQGLRFDKERSYITMWAPLSLTSPDMFVFVDFGEAFTAATRPSNTTNLRHETVMLLVALTEEPDDVMSHTVPVYLSPGMHLVAHVVRSFSRQFRYPPLGALGVLEFMSRTTFLTAEILALTPDPEFAQATDSRTQATLRIVHQDDVRKLQVEEEYMEATVVSGLSKLGGLWTPLNGMFVMLFGTSLLMSAGSKPLSTFGFVHQFVKTQVSAKWRNKYYPDLKEDVEKWQERNAGDVTNGVGGNAMGFGDGNGCTERKGLLKFVFDHFLDTEYLFDRPAGQGPPQSNPDIEANPGMQSRAIPQHEHERSILQTSTLASTHRSLHQQGLSEESMAGLIRSGPNPQAKSRARRY